VPHDRFHVGARHVIVVNMTELRLRGMIESWEREGLIAPEAAAQLLRPGGRGPKPRADAPERIQVGEGLGYLGAAVVIAAGMLVAITPHGGAGSLLLAGLLVMVAMRRARPQRSTVPDAGVPRHRASHPAQATDRSTS
jgi:hypothetical protein